MAIDTTRYHAEPYRSEAEPESGVYSAGAVAGLIAGVVMALAMMGRSSGMGDGYWTPMNVIAGTWLGVDALVGGAWTTALGVVTHLIAAAFWGAVFSALIRRRETVFGAFWEGLLFSVGVWLIMTYIGLPIFDRTMIPRAALMPGWWFYEHLIYGACLCITPALRRAINPPPQRIVRTERVYPRIRTQA